MGVDVYPSAMKWQFVFVDSTQLMEARASPDHPGYRLARYFLKAVCSVFLHQVRRFETSIPPQGNPVVLFTGFSGFHKARNSTNNPTHTGACLTGGGRNAWKRDFRGSQRTC